MAPIPIKSPEEIETMREGGRVLRELLRFVAHAVRPGVSTAELDHLAENFIAHYPGMQAGFKGYKGFPASLCVSVNDEVVHGIPRPDRFLKEGDIVGLDSGILYKGFYTDAAVTVPAGEPDPDVRYFMKITKKALQNALRVIRDGSHVGDISAAIQKTLETQGYSPVIDCTGHGVGRHLHEPPEILNAGRRGAGSILRTGMTLAIEPISSTGTGKILTLDDGWTIVTADHSLSAHFEHTVAVTEYGCEILT